MKNNNIDDNELIELNNIIDKERIKQMNKIIKTNQSLENELLEIKNIVNIAFEKYDNLKYEVLGHAKEIEHINKDLKEFREDAKISLKAITDEIGKMKDFIIDQIGDLYDHVKTEIEKIRKDSEKKISNIDRKYNAIVWIVIGGAFSSLLTFLLLLLTKIIK